MRQSLIAISILAVLPIASVGAAPIRYRMGVSVPVRESHPLSGAHVGVDVTWDAVGLTPRFNYGRPGRGVITEAFTGWPPTNTKGTVTITGATPFDGVFPISLSRLGWEVRRYNDSTHLVYFPELLVELGEAQLEISRMSVRYASVSVTNSLPAYPEPFTSASVIRAQAGLISPSGSFAGLGITTVSGYARLVPEPSTLALGPFALLSLAALRRRK